MPKQVPQPATDLHEPGKAQVDDQTTEDVSGTGRENAQDEAAKEGRDTFAEGFAEVDGEVENSHRKDDAVTGITDKPYNKPAAEEKYYDQECNAIGYLIN